MTGLWVKNWEGRKFWRLRRSLMRRGRARSTSADVSFAHLRRHSAHKIHLISSSRNPATTFWWRWKNRSRSINWRLKINWTSKWKPLNHNFSRWLDGKDNWWKRTSSQQSTSKSNKCALTRTSIRRCTAAKNFAPNYPVWSVRNWRPRNLKWTDHLKSRREKTTKSKSWPPKHPKTRLATP